MKKTAILVDGGFYQKRAQAIFGIKTPEERAEELISYCLRHLKNDHDRNFQPSELYRIFYYDCPPLDKVVFHPLTRKQVDLKKTSQYNWMTSFHECIVTKRKVALRRGEILETSTNYTLNPDIIKKLCNGALSIADLKEEDFHLDIKQKGVDMRIGLDIASLAHKRQVDQIVLIAGDSDFVPAAKHARREGIDFILDPMWHTIKPSLNEHIDGLRTCVTKGKFEEDKLHVKNVKK